MLDHKAEASRTRHLHLRQTWVRISEGLPECRFLDVFDDRCSTFPVLTYYMNMRTRISLGSVRVGERRDLVSKSVLVASTFFAFSSSRSCLVHSISWSMVVIRISWDEMDVWMAARSSGVGT